MENKQYDFIGNEYISAKRNHGSVKSQKSKEFVFDGIDMKGKVVLDLGCGYGEDIPYSEKEAKEVYGVDSSEVMISQARKNAMHPQRIVLADILKLPFSENKFDIVIARHSLHYINDIDSAWKEINRVLKKGGLLIFTVPHPFSEIFLKKSKDYSIKEEISFNAHKKFTLNFPSHKLSDYMTKYFFEEFDIFDLWEFTKEEDWIKDIISPVVLGIKATKK